MNNNICFGHINVFPFMARILICFWLISFSSSAQWEESYGEAPYQDIDSQMVTPFDSSEEISDSFHEEPSIHFEMEEPPAPVVKYAFLTLFSDPSGATVYIDDIEKGVTPFHDSTVVPGKHTITLKKKGYKLFSKTMDFVSEDKKKITVRLGTQNGFITILSAPSEAEVNINDKNVGTTPVVDRPLKPGTYSINVSKENHRDYSRKILINRRIHDTLRCELMSEATIDSITKVRKKKLRIFRHISIGTVAGIVTVAGIRANNQCRDALSREEGAKESYQKAGLTTSQFDYFWKEYSSAKADANKKIKKRNRRYIISGILWTGFALSIAF
ncbi:MAG: PEGA domain-containing protein [Chitinivibrionales bacterium]|nr:PEGA domain-containing protein [Chitinivibrionales bacterium]